VAVGAADGRNRFGGVPDAKDVVNLVVRVGGIYKLALAVTIWFYNFL